MTVPRISNNEAAQLLADGYAYLDVRSVQEFELGHVAGAFNVPWLLHGETLPNPLFLETALRALATARGVVVGCQSGQRSKLACSSLAEHLVRPLVEHRAGFGGRRDAFGELLEPGWQRAGLAVSYQAQPGRSYEELLGSV